MVKVSILSFYQGAMGSFFGGLLAEKGLDVVLIDVWEEHVNNINKAGLRIVGVGGDRFVKVRATTNPAGEAPVDIVFVQCKAAHTRQAVLGAKKMFHQVRREGLYYPALTETDPGRGRSSYHSKMVWVTRS